MAESEGGYPLFDVYFIAGDRSAEGVGKAVWWKVPHLWFNMPTEDWRTWEPMWGRSGRLILARDDAVVLDVPVRLIDRHFHADEPRKVHVNFKIGG